MTTEISSWLADNLKADVVPASIRLDPDLSSYMLQKTLPWHTWSPCPVVHILFRLCERVKVRGPGVTIIFPYCIVSASFVLGLSYFSFTWPNRLLAFLRIIDEGMLRGIPSGRSRPQPNDEPGVTHLPKQRSRPPKNAIVESMTHSFSCFRAS
jgi:hypothetical protein